MARADFRQSHVALGIPEIQLGYPFGGLPTIMIEQNERESVVCLFGGGYPASGKNTLHLRTALKQRGCAL